MPTFAVRRLTSAEYKRTAHDLLGVDLPDSVGFPPDEIAYFFQNNAKALTLSPVRAEQYMNAAEALAARTMATPERLLPCASAPDVACARKFVREVGQRAFRRPLRTDEAAAFDKLYDDYAADGPRTALEIVVRALLISPQFVFRIEEAPGGKPSSYEMASRLSYFLWGSMPDAALFEAAAGNQLATPAQIAAQATRMLSDPRAKAALVDVFGQWLRLDDIPLMEKSRTAFPTFTPELPKLLRQETEAFLQDTLFGPDATLAALFTSTRTSLNKSLAAFYGITDKAPAGDAFEPASHNPAERGGFLTLAGPLAAHAGPVDGSPTLRGAFVRRRVLCTELPLPPANVEMQKPPPVATSTTRERTKQHATNPSCAGCHALIDPVGFLFESYDGLGRFRREENGKAIDDAGEISGTSVGAVKGAVALGQKLAASPDAAACLATAVFRNALGRAEAAADQESISKLRDVALESKAGALQRLLIAVTQTDAFSSFVAAKGSTSP